MKLNATLIIPVLCFLLLLGYTYQNTFGSATVAALMEAGTPIKVATINTKRSPGIDRLTES